VGEWDGDGANDKAIVNVRRYANCHFLASHLLDNLAQVSGLVRFAGHVPVFPCATNKQARIRFFGAVVDELRPVVGCEAVEVEGEGVESGARLSKIRGIDALLVTLAHRLVKPYQFPRFLSRSRLPLRPLKTYV